MLLGGNLLLINTLRLFREIRSARRVVLMAAVAPALAGCAMSVGPSRGAIEKAPAEADLHGIRVLELDDNVASRTNYAAVDGNFAQNLGDATPVGTRVGVGDVLEVTIWEAPPAALFGPASLDTRVGSSVQAGRPNALPELVVGPSGTISIPFAGQVPAAGRSLSEIEHDIVARLNGRAHLPQAIVRISRNETKTVAVLGDVKAAQRVPLTPRGERLLDAIAQAGGTSQPLDRMTIEISRGGVTQRMAARDILRDPKQNIVLKSDDVITAYYQPYSFTVLGAAGRNEEVRFEGLGLTLSQALGRVGGLQNERADPEGVFLFRWELPQVLGGGPSGAPANGEGRVPVVYKVDMKRPETFFAAQKFQMRDGDVVYVSNSRLADLQRFVGIVSASILPVATARTVLP
jgi:polysaccharide export outer membrane protein